MSVGAVPVSAWIATQRAVIEAALDRFVPASAEPGIVHQAMRYSLLAGGKRLRPLLALAAAEAVAERQGTPVGDARDLALGCACALEMIHTYSLVHDDLPAMDNDTLRRGRPTAHVVYGEGMAILAGDALLTAAFALLAREPHAGRAVQADDLAMRKISTIGIIAEAAGARGMVGGQAIDLRAADGTGQALTRETLKDMHARKTGALIRAAVLGGATMAGATLQMFDALDIYASQVGLAFQIVDDILDVEGASKDLGKTAGKDAAAGKPTYPAHYGLDASRRLAAECIDGALAGLDRAGLSGHLPALAQWVTSRHS
jgi:geranylgeranyl pyrophosphate synthase